MHESVSARVDRGPGAAAVSARRTRRCGGPAVALLLTLLLLVVPGGPVGAQTGLVLAGPGAASLEDAVPWIHGPVALVEEGALEDGAAVDRAASRLLEGGARVVVVVPLSDRVRTGEVDGRERVRVTAAVPGARAADVVAAATAALTGPAFDVAAVFPVEGFNVTATRSARDVFGTAAPVSVLDGDVLERRAPRGPLDLFREVPGLEVEGVGPVRRQPVVRGFTGQRVLLLEDGLRLANARRRLDSVEPVALAGVGSIRRVEVVRGPASVLYGSDAIGGVVNLVTRGPPAAGEPLTGEVRLVAGTAGDLGRATVDAAGRVGPSDGSGGGVGWRLSVGGRRADPYRAPAGRFGDLVLDDEVRVQDSGVRDRRLRAELTGHAGPVELFGRVEAYDAEGTGFGFVEPDRLGQDARVRLTFPDHAFLRAVAGVRASKVGPLAHELEAVAYHQANDRDFVTDVTVPLGPGAPPGAEVSSLTTNRTEVDARGGRVEARRRIGPHHLLTYGVEVVREEAVGWDTTATTVRGLGPERTTVEADEAVPDARRTSVGVFAQDGWALTPATELTLGARYQRVRATTLESDPGATGDGSAEGPAAGAEVGRVDEDTFVGAASLLHRWSAGVSVMASLARGFRSPNLVERFFSGPVPGGQGVWVRNPELGPETSVNLDLGVRVRRGLLRADLFVFRTELHDGIRLEPTGREVDGVPEYRNENVERLRVQGVEAWLGWTPGSFTLTASATLLDRSNPDDADDPLVEGSTTRWTGSVGRSLFSDRVELEYAVRWHGSQRETLGRRSPVGEEVPSYAVHDLHADVGLPGGHSVGVSVENLFDRLYARPGNVGFFRPEPGRSLVVRWTGRF